MHCPSYIHYAMTITKGNHKLNHRMVSCTRERKLLQPAHPLQFIPLTQALLHSLLHQPSSRTRHFELALANFHIAKAENARAVRRTATWNIVAVVSVAEYGLRCESNCRCEAITGGKQSWQSGR